LGGFFGPTKGRRNIDKIGARNDHRPQPFVFLDCPGLSSLPSHLSLLFNPSLYASFD
jgi:hypothetical protein